MTTTDLSDPSRWFTWTGNRLVGSGTGSPAMPCLLNDGRGQWQRHATHRTYSYFTLSGWFEWERNNDPGGPDFLGLHFGVIQDNDHGYHFSIKPGVLSLLVEYGGKYSRLTADIGAPYGPADRSRHQFAFLFTDSYVLGRVNDTVIREDDGAHHRFPRIHSGRAGMRLDRQRVRLGSLVLKEH